MLSTWDKAYILLSGIGLTLYKTTEKIDFKLIAVKRKNDGNQNFLFFSSPKHKVLKGNYCGCPISGICHPLSVNNFFKHIFISYSPESLGQS